jgi:cysteine desulfuration protein SufE
MTISEALPPRLNEILDDFRACEGEEKLELLLEFSDKMQPLPERLHSLRDTMEHVHECMTPVLAHAELVDGGLHFYFDIPLEAPTVRGYAAMLGEGLHGSTPQQVMALPNTLLYDTGLQHVIGPQRLNGMAAMLAYIKRLAFRHMPRNNSA